MKKKFTIGGAVLGFAYGAGIMAYTFLKFPGRPGIFELLVQIGIVGTLAAFGALLGLFVGWLVSLIYRNKNETIA